MIGITNANFGSINVEGISSTEVSKNTVFNNDSIVEKDVNNNIKTTVFNSDGSITETLKNSKGEIVTIKTTTFNADGSISEVVE